MQTHLFQVQDYVRGNAVVRLTSGHRSSSVVLGADVASVGDQSKLASMYRQAAMEGWFIPNVWVLPERSRPRPQGLLGRLHPVNQLARQSLRRQREKRWPRQKLIRRARVTGRMPHETPRSINLTFQRKSPDWWSKRGALFVMFLMASSVSDLR